MDSLPDDLVLRCLVYAGEATCVYNVRATHRKVCMFDAAYVWKKALRAVMDKNLYIYLLSHHLENLSFSKDVVLSGSSLVQVTLGRKWYPSDTDLFCTEEARERIHKTLGGAGYSCVWVTQKGEYRSVKPYDGSSENGDEYESSGAETDEDDIHDASDVTMFPNIRREPIQAVEKWSKLLPPTDTCSVNRHNVDVIVAMPGAPDAKVLLEHFDLVVCQAAYDGNSFHWPDPVGTFTGQSNLTPLVGALLTGFLTGWNNGGYQVDECVSQKHFLETDQWRTSVRAAVDSAEKFFEPPILDKLRTCVIDSSESKYFLFFYKQFRRVIKYQRRGFAICNLPSFETVWAALSHVGSLPKV